MSKYVNPSDVNWSKGIETGLDYTNEVTASIFSNLILFGIFVIFAIGYYSQKKDILASIVVGLFITWSVAVFLLFAGFVGGWTFSLLTVGLILSYLVLHIERGKE